MTRESSTQMTGAALCAVVLLGLVAGPAIPIALADDTDPSDPSPFRQFEKTLVIDFNGDIEQMMFAYVGRRLDRVEPEGFDCVVLRIESPGGTVFHSQEISERLHGMPDNVHVVAWIPKQALSGACMVAMACDEILMGDSATLGDCQPIVIDPSGGGIKPVGEKIESPLRALFRKYATKNGYPPLLAEAFVSAHLHVIRVESKSDGSQHFVQLDTFEKAKDDDVVVDGYRRSDLIRVGDAIVNDQQLLTVTADQASDLGFVRRKVDPNKEENVLDLLRAEGGETVMTEMNFSEKAGKWLLAISGILSAIVALAIMVTVFQQTFGIVQIAGLVSLVLIILINLTADQLNGFPLFLIALGILLLVAEVFLIPGFGVAGILGMVSMGAGFLFLASGASFGETDGRLTSDWIVDFGLQFVATAIAGFMTLFLLSKWFPNIGPGRGMILAAPDGATVETPSPIHTSSVSVGSVGTAVSTLRPAGTATFDGELVDVVTSGNYINEGEGVRVIDVEGARVVVEKAELSG